MFLSVQSRTLAALYAVLPLLLNFNLVHGQTPPNYGPSTSNTLNISFNGDLLIYPGQLLQPAGMMACP